MRSLAPSFLCLCLLCQSAFADTWSAPSIQKLESSDGTWSAEVIPSQQYYNQNRAKPAMARLTSGGETTEFELLNVWAPAHAFILNDGRLFTLDNYGKLGSGDEVAALYDHSGALLWKRSLEELVDLGTRSGAMMTTSSTWWKKHPLEWDLDEPETKFTLTLHNENKLEISLSDGSTRIVEVLELDNDPDRFLDRGMSYLRSRDFEEAELHLKRAIQLSPAMLEAYRGLARVYKQQNRHGDTVALLKNIRKIFEDYPQRHNLANLYCDLAAAYHELGNFAAEESVLRDAMELSTGYSYPVIRLAENFEAQHKTDAIAPLFHEFYHLNSEEGYKVLWIVKDIGDYYAANEQHVTAIQWYLRGTERDNTSKALLYLNLAKSYEALGRMDDAVATYRRLIADEKAAGKGKYYIEQAERHIARITALTGSPTPQP